MKKQLSNFLKLSALLVCIYFLAISCENESVDIDNQTLIENGTNPFIKKGNINEYQELKNYVSKLQNHKTQNRSDAVETSVGFTILENIDIYVFSDSLATTYTIPILKDDQTEFGFSNLIVKYDVNDNPVENFILNYVPTEQYLSNYINYWQTPYEGTIEYESLNPTESSESRTSARCGTETVTLTFCSYPNDDPEDGYHVAGASCTPAYMWSETVEIIDAGCSGGGGSGSSGSGTGGTSGGSGTGGGGISGPGGPNPTSPIPSDTCESSRGDVGITGSDGCVTPSNQVQIFNELNEIIGINDSFIFDDTLNDTNALSFDNVNAFELYISDSSEELLGVNESLTQQGTFTTKFKVNLIVTSINIDINQKLKDDSINQDYQVLRLDTSYSGLTFASSWTQGNYNYVVVGNEAIITLNGTINYNLIIDGIGTLYTDAKTYEMRININTGEPISITEINN